MNAITRQEFSRLLEDAPIRPRLKRELRFVPEEITDWEDRDFISVTTRGGQEGVLVALLEKQHVVPFRLHRRQPNYTGRIEAIICDICATWQRGSHSAVLTFHKEKGSVSYLCCADLLCSFHVRDKTPASKLSRTQLRENNTVNDRILRLKNKLAMLLG